MRRKAKRRKPAPKEPLQAMVLPYFCAILAVPPDADYWGTYSVTLCDAKISGLPLYGCCLYPFWQHQPDNGCRPKFVPSRRLIVFAASEPLPPPSPDGVVIVNYELETTKKMLESGVSLQSFRNQDVRLPLQQSNAA